MKLQCIIFLAVCAFVAANVTSREKRLVNGIEIKCAAITPCAWTPYNEVTGQMMKLVKSDYCECKAGYDCVITEDDTNAHSYVHRCRLPNDPNKFEID